MMKACSASETTRESRRSRDWSAIAAVIAALLVVVLLVSAYFIFRPRSMVVRVAGPPGTRFVGNVTVDQRSTYVTGTTPAELKFRGRHLAFNVMPLTSGTESFRVALAGEEVSGEFGVGGWNDAREVVPDVDLQPLTEDDWTRLRNQYRRSRIMQGTSPPAQ